MPYLSEKNEHGSYKVYWDNGIYVGDFIIGDDGYYAYWPPQKNGYVTEYFLIAMAEMLNKLNADWDNTVQSDRTIN